MSNRDDRIRRQQTQLARDSACPAGSSSGAPARVLGGLALAPDGARRVRRRRRRQRRLGRRRRRRRQVRRDLELDRATWTRRCRRRSRRTTGIDLTYDEDINANNEYFAKIQPEPAARARASARDGFVLTDWMANRLINQVKWVAAARRGRRSRTRRTCAPALAVAGFDPDPQVQRAVGERRHRHRVQHRRSPARRSRRSTTSSRSTGTTTVLDEMRDTIGLFMRSLGIEHRRRRPTPRPSPRSTSSTAAFDDGKIDGTRQRVRRTTSATATSPPRSRGRATSRRSRSTTRTSASRSRSRRDALVRQLHDPVHDATRPTSRASSSTSSTTRRTRRCSWPYIQYISPVDGRRRASSPRWAARPPRSSTTRS